MTGKVFNESVDIYQDQARVLFDYYKNAATKIVMEETACEQERAQLESRAQEAQKVKIQAEEKAQFHKKLTYVLIITVIFWIIPFFIRRKQEQIAKDAGEEIQRCLNKINEIGIRYKNIRRDYSVDKIGVVYVPVATRVPFSENSFLIDHTGSVENQSFQLPLLHQPEAFQETMQELQKSIESMPVVESSNVPEEVDTSEYSLSMQNITLHDYVGNLDRQVRNINYLLGDSRIESVEIPTIDPKGEVAAFIREHATTETGDKPVINVFNGNFQDKLNKLTQIDAAKEQFSLSEDEDSIDYMKRMMLQLAESVQIFSNTKNASSSALTNYASSILSLVLKAGYTQYSPLLEADEINRLRSSGFDFQTDVKDYTPFNLKKSSQVKYDLIGRSWVAEDGSRTAMPFGMHQVDEDVLQPVIETLMKENRSERLKIYANIEDQKRIYLDRWNSEIGNYFRDNRAACDELINRMRDTYADYAAAYSMYQSLKATTDNMKKANEYSDEEKENGKENKQTYNLAASEVSETDSEAEMIAGFEKQAEDCNQQQEKFAEYMDRIQDSINEMTESFSHIEFYEASLRDSVSRDTAIAMSDIHKLSRRQKELLSVSPYLASYGKMPPEPMVSDVMLEQVQMNLIDEAQQKLKEMEPGDAD